MWTQEERGTALIGRVSGRIDELHWEAFAEALKAGVEAAAGGGRKSLVLDLSGVDYISSRGLRALTIGKKHGDAAGVMVTIAAPNEMVREILAISRYDKLFAIHDNVDAAVEA
jgi:anti-sigma B factor antagonist